MTALMTDLKRLSSMRAPDGFAERVLIEVGIAQVCFGEVHLVCLNPGAI